MAIREKIVLDTRQYRKGLRDVEKNASRTARNTEQSWDRSSRKMEDDTRRASRKMEGSFKKIGAAAKMYIAAAATSAFLLLRKAFTRAQEVEETASKYETVLGPAIGKANEFIKENARLMGLSRTAAKETIATTAAIAQGMGFAGDHAADFSFDIVKLAGDLQSFNDVPIERTHRAITSALTGEREALKSLGIVIRETEVQERALANTGKDAADALTQQEKATATLELITKKAGVAVGDLERTSSSSANRTRQVWAGVQTMLDGLSEKLNQNFGPTLIKWLENALEVAEDLVSTIDRSMSSDMENLIRNLEAQGGNEGLVARLNKQLAINEAIALRRELKKELSEMEIAVSIDEKGFTDRVKDVRDSLKGTLFASPLNDFFGNEGGVMDTFNKLAKGFEEDFKTINESFDPAKIDEYNERIGALQEQLQAVTEQALKAEQMGFTEEAEELSGLSNIIADAISQMQLAIGKQEQLNNVNESLSKMMAGGVEAPATEQAKQKFNEVVIGIQKVEAAWVQLGQQMETGAGSIMQTHLNELARATENYNNTLTKLNNDVATGAISQEKYQKDLNAASEKYYKQLSDTYKLFRDQLSPEQQKMFEALIKNLKGTEKETEKVKASLGDIADMVSGLLSVADAIGKMDDNLKNVLRGSIDVLKNLENLKEMKDRLGEDETLGLSGALPMIGIAGGVASLLSGFFNNSDREKEMNELRLTMQSLERAVRENTKAFLEQGLVGSDVAQADVKRAEQLISEIEKSWNKINWAEVLIGKEGDLKGARNRLKELGELFPELYGDHLEMFNNLVKQGDYGGAMEFLGTIGDIFDEVADSVGQFGESLEGAIEKFQIMTRLGVGEQEAFQTFIEDVIGLIGEDNDLTKLLQEIAKSETEEERKALAKQLFELFQANPGLLGENLTGDDLKSIIDTILGISSEGYGEGSSEQEFSRSVQIARTITDIQANEVIVLLEWIGQAVWRLVEMAGGEVIEFGNNGISPINIEIPLPVKIMNWGDMPKLEVLVSGDGGGVRDGDGGGGPRGGGDGRGGGPRGDRLKTINVGGIQVNGGGAMSDAEFDSLMRRIGSELKREIKSRTF